MAGLDQCEFPQATKTHGEIKAGLSLLLSNKLLFEPTLLLSSLQTIHEYGVSI